MFNRGRWQLKRLFARILNVAKRRRGDCHLQEEMRDHPTLLQTEENIRAVMPLGEARRQAAMKLGSIEAIRESCHAEEGVPLIESLLQDIRYGARLLVKNRGFTVVAATSLALAIGANTTVFSIAKQLLYERLAVPKAANLRLLTWTATEDHVAVHHVFDGAQRLPGGRVTSAYFSYPAYQELRAHNQVLGDLIAFHATGMNVTAGEDTERVEAHEVSGNYYSVLGVQPELGRGIRPSDDTTASQPVAVISDELWAREFGRSPTVLGRWIKLNDVPVIIVGVNPKNFTGAKSTLQMETPVVTVSAYDVRWARAFACLCQHYESHLGAGLAAAAGDEHSSRFGCRTHTDFATNAGGESSAHGDRRLLRIGSWIFRPHGNAPFGRGRMVAVERSGAL